MNKMMMKMLFAMLTVLVLLTGAACAEDANDVASNPGNLPERGLIFPMTEADENELGISLSYMVIGLVDLSEVPLMDINITDYKGMEEVKASYSEEDLEDPDTYWEMQYKLYDYIFNIYSIVLLEKDYYDAKMAAGITMESVLGIDGLDYYGENDGYVYIGVNNYEGVFDWATNEEQKVLLEKGIARCKEIVAGLAFQPIEFAEGEFTVVPDSALEFSTLDLSGNVVTQDIFMGKTLTVLNVWDTFCTPCIDEMPELAEWSQTMPEGVQLVGLVCDLESYDNAEILELAQYICEATGADVYTSLVANEDFMGLLQGVIGVPTTFFIDGTGAFVGEPVVGANVPGCKAFVEEYLAK